jgi:hypothetical protein
MMRSSGPALPTEPSGAPSTRVTARPPSVAPKPSMTYTPNRFEKASTTCGAPSLPYATRTGLSASSGPSGWLRM